MSGADLPVLEEVSKSIIQEKQPFERLEMSKEDLLEMFKVCAWLTLLTMLNVYFLGMDYDDHFTRRSS